MKQFQVVLDTCHKEWSIDNDRGVTQLLFRNKFGKRLRKSSSKN